MPEPAQQVVAEIRDYQQLIAFFRRWFLGEMRTTFSVIDDLAGLPHGYTAKLFAPGQIRRLGQISLGPLLSAGALKMLIAVDREALQRITQHQRFRLRAKGTPYSCTAGHETGQSMGKKMLAVPAAGMPKNPGHFDSELGRIMRARHIITTHPNQRSAIARRAARARWAKAKWRAAQAAPSAAPENLTTPF